MSRPLKHTVDADWLRDQVQVHTIRELEKISGIPRDTLHRWMKRYGIESPRPKHLPVGNKAYLCKKKVIMNKLIKA